MIGRWGWSTALWRPHGLCRLRGYTVRMVKLTPGKSVLSQLASEESSVLLALITIVPNTSRGCLACSLIPYL